MPDHRDAESYATELARLIGKHFLVVLSDKAVRMMTFFFGQVGPSNMADLASSIYLECWTRKDGAGSIAEGDVVRAADRVRKQITREAKRIHAAAVEHVADSDVSQDEAEAHVMLREFMASLKKRSLPESILFQKIFLEGGGTVKGVAKELGISPATAYRWINEFKAQLLGIHRLKDQFDG